jgi:hypothetical protein
MAAKEKIEFTRTKVEASITSFTPSKDENKKKAWALGIGTAFISGVTTMLLGFPVSSDYQALTRNIAFILSAVVTFLGIVENYYNYREMWVRYTETLNSLKAILTELDYLQLKCGEIEEKDVDKIFRRYQQVLDDTNTWWTNLRGGSRPTETA